jgi:hypothetical protein
VLPEGRDEISQFFAKFPPENFPQNGEFPYRLKNFPALKPKLPKTGEISSNMVTLQR